MCDTREVPARSWQTIGHRTGHVKWTPTRRVGEGHRQLSLTRRACVAKGLRFLGRRAGGARFEEAAESLMVTEEGEIGVRAGPVPAVAPGECFLQQAQRLID